MKCKRRDQGAKEQSGHRLAAGGSCRNATQPALRAAHLLATFNVQLETSATPPPDWRTRAGFRMLSRMADPKQVVVTVASGGHAGRLDETFLSFAKNPSTELHAFILGDALPANQVPGIHYHLVAPDPNFQDPMRDLYYRRFLFIDELGADYALIVDNSDVLCLHPLPPFPQLLRGAMFAGCAEHQAGRYLLGQGYTSNYLNAGVTFWDVKKSRTAREEIVARGRSRFRSVDDQLTLNEVLLTRYYDQLTLLPCQYNYRAHLAPTRTKGWPTVNHLDGVVLYHNSHCVAAAKQLTDLKDKAALPALETDAQTLTPLKRMLRKIQNRLQPHVIK